MNFQPEQKGWKGKFSLQRGSNATPQGSASNIDFSKFFTTFYIEDVFLKSPLCRAQWPNVYVNIGTSTVSIIETLINSSIRFFPIPQEMSFQVARIALPTSALSPGALSKPHCRGSREMHGSRRDALVRTLRRRRALPSQLSRALPALPKISWIFLPAYQLSSSVRECFAKRTLIICKWFCLLAFTWRTVTQFWLQMTKCNLYWLLVKRMYWTNNFLQVIPHLGAQSLGKKHTKCGLIVLFIPSHPSGTHIAGF